MATQNYFVNSVEVWSHTPLCMSCDLIKIWWLITKGYGTFLSTFFKTQMMYFWSCTQVCAKKQNVLWSTVICLCLHHLTSLTALACKPAWWVQYSILELSKFTKQKFNWKELSSSLMESANPYGLGCMSWPAMSKPFMSWHIEISWQP